MNIKMPQVLLIPILITAWCICASAQFTPSAKPKPVPTKPGTPCVAYTFIQAQDTGINSICNSITLLWSDLNTSAGGGTVTVVASGSLTSGAFVTGGGGTTIQTPSPTATLDGSGNASFPGSVTAPNFVGSGTGAGYLELHQGAAPAPGTTAIQIVAPVSVTSYRRTLAGAAASGIPHFSNSANVVTETISAIVSADLSITTTTCTNQFVTAISAGGVGTCNSVTLAGAQFANQGTTTTVLHGNASGNPSFGTVALGTDVSGTLAASQFPALTGDITTSAGALATSLKSTGTAGTYRSVTFDAQGRETSGTNPTTFSGYGLSDTSANLRAALTDENGSGVALFDSSTSATFITPTIASFTNATHNHTNAAGGGTLAEAALALTDVTTDNVSTSAHGFAPKAPNDATKYLDGTGAYSVPTGGSTLPVTDTTGISKGSSDATKIVRFEVDGFTTGTTRVITPPNSDTTLPIASQVITFSGPTAARTYTLPDAAATMARTDAGQTFTGVNVFTSPKLITSVSDTNGNTLFGITATGSAVNNLAFANAASGSGPTISSAGSGTDIDINLVPKGVGVVVVPLGSVGAMGLSFGTNNGSSGIYGVAGGSIGVVSGSNLLAFFNAGSGQTVINRQFGLCFPSAATNGAVDVCITRPAVSVLSYNDGSTNGMAIQMPQKAATPANPGSSAEVNFYIKSSKIVFQWNNGGTVRYLTYDLTQSSTALWATSTSAP